jgi:hypothetical protein
MARMKAARSGGPTWKLGTVIYDMSYDEFFRWNGHELEKIEPQETADVVMRSDRFGYDEGDDSAERS